MKQIGKGFVLLKSQRCCKQEPSFVHNKPSMAILCGLLPKKARVTEQQLTIWLFLSSLQNQHPSFQNSKDRGPFAGLPTPAAAPLSKSAKNTSSHFLPSSHQRTPVTGYPVLRGQCLPGCPHSWPPSLEVHRLGFNHSTSPCIPILLKHTHLFMFLM